MIILDYDHLIPYFRDSDRLFALFHSLDNGDVVSMLKSKAGVPDLKGTLVLCDQINQQSFGIFEDEDDRVRVLVKRELLSVKNINFEKISDLCSARQLIDGSWVNTDVRLVSLKDQLFSRFGGIMETDVIADRKVLVLGAGSFGSEITMGLIKSGVAKLGILDDDRVDICNVMRHVCGLTDIGRLKTSALKDAILDKNPTAEVAVYHMRVNWDNMESLRTLVSEYDIVVCAIDDHDGKVITNTLCVEEGKNCIFSGAFRRAYGGQILRVRPGKSLCYQCFLRFLPSHAANVEVASQGHSDAISYSDRPVPVEPGLANDIAPLTQMTCKLVVQELLTGRQTTLRSLDEDLVAPLYMWFNRREKDTDQQRWQPLEYDCNGMHIMRWYGIAVDADPGCPVCGDFSGESVNRENIEVSAD